MDDKKWNWLGYGYYLASGKVYWVRGYEYVNAGVKNHNGHGVSICVEGNYDIEAPSKIDMVNLEALIIRLKKELPNLKHIKGHNEDYPTTCPGQYFPMDRF